MVNKWIEHIKTFAKQNNLSFACALNHPKLKETYTPIIKKSYKEKREEIMKINQINVITTFIKRIKTMEDDDKPLMKMKYNGFNQSIKDIIKKDYTKYYNKLFDK